MGDTLFVRSFAQKIIFERELQGQLSDGIWENEDTDVRLWNCEVRVASESDLLGCNFKTKYPVDLCDDAMTDFLADRAMGYVLAFIPEYTFSEYVNDLVDLTNIVFGK
jgi:hypothetical protein